MATLAYEFQLAGENRWSRCQSSLSSSWVAPFSSSFSVGTVMEKLNYITMRFRLTCSLRSTPLHNNILSPDQALRSRVASRAKKAEEIAVSRREEGLLQEEEGVVDGAWLWRVTGQKCVRRQVLVGIGAWPFLATTMGRQAVNAAGLPEDPAEMAVVAALDARDMLPGLSTFLLQAKSKLGPSVECQSRLKSLNRIYERLKVNLPRLVEELEIGEEFVEQLLQVFVYVEEDLCTRMMLSSTMSENSSISRMNIDGSLKLLKLARSKVDILLQKVPRELLELAQLARGVRPMA